MDLLRSITVDATPSVTGLLRFAFVEALRAIKTVLLFYPLNVLLLCLFLFLAVHRITSKFGGKKRFKAVYELLPHHDSAVEELKLIKKEVRDVQADLIAIIKNSNGDAG
jgi:hypothetical protein